MKWNQVKEPVYMPGEFVAIAEGDINGQVIRAILFADGLWKYVVTWWHDGQRYEYVLQETEILRRKA